MEVAATINDEALLRRIALLSSQSNDPTGNWIGPGRPRTDFAGDIGAASPAPAYAKWSAVHYSFYAALMALDAAPDKDRMLALDLGCAGGARTAQLAQVYGAALGIDRDQHCIDFANEFHAGPKIAFRRDDWPCAIGAPDRIFAVEFFEHFAPEHQATAIAKAIDALALGGLLFITMPNEAPQAPPHAGCRLSDDFDNLMSCCAGKEVHRGWFDNAAPGDPCAAGWSPYGARSSHNFSVRRR